MTKPNATYQNGVVVLDVPTGWPDGLRVVVVPPGQVVSCQEEDTPLTVEEIATTLKAFDEVPAPTDEEAADLDRAIAEARATSRGNPPVLDPRAEKRNGAAPGTPMAQDASSQSDPRP